MVDKKQNRVVIELKEVYKHFFMGRNTVKAVDGISFKIKEGDFVAILGPSGSGKSTLMNLVGSLDVPTKGKVFLDGNDISRLTESDLAQVRGKKIGFIFQSFNLISNLTASENVMVPMIFQGYESSQRKYRSKKLMELVDLGDRGHHSPTELSGGQQQRVATARALANSPEVILADEPTGNLDSKTGKKVMNFLRNLNKKGKTIVLITHDTDLIKGYADIVYWLKDGKVSKVTKGSM